MSDSTLKQTIAVNILLHTIPKPPTNASHCCLLQMLVARHVQRILRRWESQLQVYCRKQDRVKWAVDTREWPVWPEDHEYTDTNPGSSADWIAALYIIRHVAPSRLDHAADHLDYATDQLELAVEKTVLFVEFWTKRTRNIDLSCTIDGLAKDMINEAGGQFEEVDDYPTHWELQEDEEYPPSLQA